MLKGLKLLFYPEFAKFGTYRAEGPIGASRGDIFSSTGRSVLEHSSPHLLASCRRRALYFSV